MEGEVNIVQSKTVSLQNRITTYHKPARDQWPSEHILHVYMFTIFFLYIYVYISIYIYTYYMKFLSTQMKIWIPDFSTWYIQSILFYVAWRSKRSWDCPGITTLTNHHMHAYQEYVKKKAKELVIKPVAEIEVPHRKTFWRGLSLEKSLHLSLYWEYGWFFMGGLCNLNWCRFFSINAGRAMSGESKGGYKVVSSLLKEAIKRPRIPKVSVSSSQTYIVNTSGLFLGKTTKMNGLHGESLLLILNEIANPYKSGMTIILEAFLVNGLKNYCI